MGQLEQMQAAGFSKEEAEYLLGHGYFNHKTKTTEQLLAVLQKIADVYGCDFERIKRLVVRYPQFGGLNHERVVREATVVYGDEKAVKRV